jgi:hypothetical protein
LWFCFVAAILSQIKSGIQLTLWPVGDTRNICQEQNIALAPKNTKYANLFDLLAHLLVRVSD